MGLAELTPFDDLIVETRDGEWGEGEEVPAAPVRLASGI